MAVDTPRANVPGARASLRVRLRARLGCELARLRSLPLRVRAAAAGPYLFLGRGVSLLNPGRMWLGNSIVLERDVILSCDPEGRLTIGNDVHISRGCVIACGKGELSIGDHTIIGEYTSIRNTNHGMARDQLIREQEQVCRPIRIGPDVWIGRGGAVLAGVTIGDGAVIGANSVVTKNVESYTVVAGAPACLVGMRQ